jgi:dTDP-4-dehydrorhamnose reductase
MAQHDEFPDTSIQTNIIGTSNVVLECMKRNIKLVYISTDFVYPGTEGNYKEIDGVFPVNKYAWSKLGGECAAKIYDNSLILRIAMCDKPYPHSRALVDLKKSTIFNADAARIVLKLLDKTGIVNVGGDPMFVYDFAKKTNSKIGKIFLKDIHDVEMPTDASMNCEKLEKFCAK